MEDIIFLGVLIALATISVLGVFLALEVGDRKDAEKSRDSWWREYTKAARSLEKAREKHNKATEHVRLLTLQNRRLARDVEGHRSRAADFRRDRDEQVAAGKRVAAKLHEETVVLRERVRQLESGEAHLRSRLFQAEKKVSQIIDITCGEGRS